MSNFTPRAQQVLALARKEADHAEQKEDEDDKRDELNKKTDEEVKDLKRAWARQRKSWPSNLWREQQLSLRETRRRRSRRWPLDEFFDAAENRR